MVTGWPARLELTHAQTTAEAARAAPTAISGAR
jgi:hypothetical protein